MSPSERKSGVSTVFSSAPIRMNFIFVERICARHSGFELDSSNTIMHARRIASSRGESDDTIGTPSASA